MSRRGRRGAGAAGVMLAALLVLCGCVVVPAPGYRAGAHWVPGHYNRAGFWVAGHWV